MRGRSRAVPPFRRRTRSNAWTNEETALKLKITVDGKVYEVEVDVSEPESLSPAYVPPVGQARVPAASPPAAPPTHAGPPSVAD